MIKETHIIIRNKKGKLRKYPMILEYLGGRVLVTKTPFGAKDELSCMEGARWRPAPIKGWEVKDSPRNTFQFERMQGRNPYTWFDRPVEKHEYTRPLMAHQKLMTDTCLTYRSQILAAEMGCGKSLSAIEVMEKSGRNTWWWIGPKTTLPAIRREFKKWEMDETIKVEMMTYEKMGLLVDTGDYELPDGVIFDESSKLKTHGVKRQVSAQTIADRIRDEKQGYVILMSGTPSPKSPVDIWAQAEIAFPGFLKEGSPKALKKRVSVMKKAPQNEFGGYYMEHVGWLDRDGLCNVCCQTEAEGPHKFTGAEEIDDIHAFEPSTNEVSLLFERLKGLMLVIHKKDCLDLPQKIYQEIILEPTRKLLRVARTIAETARTTIAGLIKLRQISDGFMYTEEEDGVQTCPVCNREGEIPQWVDPEDDERVFDAIDMFDEETVKRLKKRVRECPKCHGDGEIPVLKRVALKVPCPKEDALNDILDKADSQGRILVFAGYQGSVDRCVEICQEAGWDVFKCDGRGTQIIKANGKKLHVKEPLDYWADTEGNEKVAFVANPESGGFGLTLVEASIAVFYSNSYKPEYRTQAEDRLHRPGQTMNVTIYDLLHLPTDKRTLDIVRENRKLEKMVLGDIIGDCLDG